VNTLKLEDMLEGETKFGTWNSRVLLLNLEENDLKEYVEDVVFSPADIVDLEFHMKSEVRISGCC
jgi:hypothetical protein